MSADCPYKSANIALMSQRCCALAALWYHQRAVRGGARRTVPGEDVGSWARCLPRGGEEEVREAAVELCVLGTCPWWRRGPEMRVLMTFSPRRVGGVG